MKFGTTWEWVSSLIHVRIGVWTVSLTAIYLNRVSHFHTKSYQVQQQTSLEHTLMTFVNESLFDGNGPESLMELLTLHLTYRHSASEISSQRSVTWESERKGRWLTSDLRFPQGQWEENISKSELFKWSVSFSLSVCDFIPPFLVVSRWEMSAGMGLAQQSWCLISSLIRSHLLVNVMILFGL